MREDVFDLSDPRQPHRLLAAIQGGGSRSGAAPQSDPKNSVMPPSSPLAGRVRTSTAPSGPLHHRHGAEPARIDLLGQLARIERLRAGGAGRAERRQGADRAGGRLRRADRGAEIHRSLGEVARPAPRHQRRRQSADLGPGRRDGRLDRHRAASPRARRCRRRPSRPRRKRSPPPPPPCSRRCRAGRAAPPRSDGKRPPWRSTTAAAQS